MHKTIKNIHDFQVQVRLSNRVNIRLAPGEECVVEAVNTKGPTIQRLVARRMISVREAESSRRRRSGDMTASEAAEYIRKAPERDLEDFLSPGEDRVTVLRAMEERKGD